MSDPTKVDHDPLHLYPEFRVKFLAALDMLADWCEIHAPGIEPVMGDGFRSTERQKLGPAFLCLLSGRAGGLQ